MRLFAITATAVALCLVVATPALAATPPTREVIRDATFFEAGRFDCGTFALDGAWTFTSITTTYYDTSGEPDRFFVHLQFDGTLTNSATGTAIRDRGDYNTWVGLASLTLHSAGSRQDTAPGVGIVFNDSGTFAYDADGVLVHIGGPLDQFRGDLTELCAVMAG